MAQTLPIQLRTAVRFLGRLLGDVIRAEDGPAVFSQIEEIRQASVAFHREGTEQAAQLMADRFLGPRLGDVIRAEDGPAVFSQIEEIRQASVAFHREGTEQAAKLMAD